MKNDTRSGVFNKYAAVSVRFSVLVCFGVQAGLMPLVALADTGLPPPAVHQTTQNGFPSSQALQRQGYDPTRGVLRVQESNSGRPTVTSNGGTITGKQNKHVTVTGKYGEKATIQTATTQKVGSSALSKVVVVGLFEQGISNAASFDNGQTAALIKNGNYGGAISQAAQTAGAFLDGVLTGGSAGSAISEAVVSEFGGKVDTAKLRDIAKDAAQKQADAEKRGDFAGATVNAAVKKAAETASSAATQAEKDKEQELKGLIRHEVIFKISIVPYGEGEVKPYYKNTHFYHSIPITGGNGAQLENGRPTVYVSNYMEYVSVDAPSYDPRKEYLVANSASWKPQSGMGEAQAKSLAEQMALNDKDLADILKRMLESQQTNHEELMNQLAKMGDVVQQSTTSQEWTAKTATTSPYTPAGSDTPQQTQFTIDQNGNITATTIMRPDLKPNSSQAPMRTEVIKNPNAQSQNQQGQQQGEMQGQNQQGHQTNQQGQHQNQQAPNTNQTGQQQNQQQQNFCQQNPRSASCADLGEADYEDLAIPEQVIDFNLVPLDVFQNNGICPASKTFDLGVLGTFEVSYEHACYVASLLRPILILINMMGCFSFAYAAVREI